VPTKALARLETRRAAGGRSRRVRRL